MLYTNMVFVFDLTEAREKVFYFRNPFLFPSNPVNRSLILFVFILKQAKKSDNIFQFVDCTVPTL